MGGELERLVAIFSALLAAGCTERAAAPEDEEEELEAVFDVNLCDSTGFAFLEAIAPVETVEYIELRDFTLFTLEQEPSQPAFILDAAGELCEGAVDEAACTAAFEALPPHSSMRESSSGSTRYRSVAVTQGEIAEAFATPEAVRGFLGPIDTPADAALLATAQFHELTCDGHANAAETEDGFILRTQTGDVCEFAPGFHHTLAVSSDGALEVMESVNMAEPGHCGGVGRVPAGLCLRRRRATTAGLGRFFADVAELEAASVHAFGQLARELALHRAPRRFVTAALRSSREEIRHAALTAQLARRFGGRPLAPRIRSLGARPLVEVAADNAVEGCLRETFGALLATLQARRATDPEVRKVMRTIAADETRHAALSWELAAWASQRMQPAERRRVAAGAREGVARLEHELFVEHPEAVRRRVGMPGADEARALFSGLARALDRSGARVVGA